MSTDSQSADKKGYNTNYLDNTVTTGSSSNGSKSDFLHPIMTEEEHNVARAAAHFGYGPLAKLNPTETYLPAFGGEFQPGLYKSVESRKIANPAPLGLSAFALTVFVLSAVNMQVRNIKEPNIVVGLAFAYGGLVQLAAGMWYDCFYSRHFLRQLSEQALTDITGRWPLEIHLVLQHYHHMAASGCRWASS